MLTAALKRTLSRNGLLGNVEIPDKTVGHFEGIGFAIPSEPTSLLEPVNLWDVR
jgi:hypothetical protein